MDDSTKTRSDSTKDESKDDVSGYDSGPTIGSLPQITPVTIDPIASAGGPGGPLPPIYNPDPVTVDPASGPGDEG